LNLFQRLMLRWRALHPYNPVHVIHIAAALDLPRLQACVTGRLQAARLTGLALDAAGRRLRHDVAGAPLPIELLPAQPDAATALRAAVERAFAEPFAPQAPTPLRGFVVAADGGFHFGLSYDHYIAGGDAIARVLVDAALDYLGAPARPAPVDVPAAPAYRLLLLRHPGWMLRALLTLPRATAATRRAHRPPVPAAAEADDGFASLTLAPAQLRALNGALQRWGVTLNDALLAALMLGVAPLAAGRQREPRRREIAVASIMNIRRDFGPAAAGSTAPCLAALRVGHAVPPGIGLEQLARDLHAQTAAIRQQHRYLQSLFGLGLSAVLWPALTPVRRQRLYLKHHPLWGGVTTLDLNRLWQHTDPAARARLDYLRAVPTGPLSPLVLAATTAHDTLHLGLAYRRAAFSAPAAAGILEAIGRHLAPDVAAVAVDAPAAGPTACAVEVVR
jgi:hypothetical protein